MLPPRRAAFTLVEVTLAMAIASISFSILVLALLQALRAGDETRRDELMAALARETMVQLRTPTAWHGGNWSHLPLLNALLNGHKLAEIAAGNVLQRTVFLNSAGAVVSAADSTSQSPAPNPPGDSALFALDVQCVPANRISAGLKGDGLGPNFLGSVAGSGQLVRITLVLNSPPPPPNADRSRGVSITTFIAMQPAG